MDQLSPGDQQWRLVLAILFPLFALACGVMVYLWVRHRSLRAVKQEQEENFMVLLGELESGREQVHAVSKKLQNGVDRVANVERQLASREVALAETLGNLNVSQSQYYGLAHPRPLSGESVSPPGSPTRPPRALLASGPRSLLPHAAPGLQCLPNTQAGKPTSRPRAPSTIHEESSGKASPSSAHSLVPLAAQKPLVLAGPVYMHTDGSIRVDSREKTHRHGLASKEALYLPPLRSDPSHPELVPSPLLVVKRNSVRESPASEPGLAKDSDTKSVRRAISNPVAARSYYEDGVRGPYKSILEMPLSTFIVRDTADGTKAAKASSPSGPGSQGKVNKVTRGRGGPICANCQNDSAATATPMPKEESQIPLLKISGPRPEPPRRSSKRKPLASLSPPLKPLTPALIRDSGAAQMPPPPRPGSANTRDSTGSTASTSEGSGVILEAQVQTIRKIDSAADLDRYDVGGPGTFGTPFMHIRRDSQAASQQQQRAMPSYASSQCLPSAGTSGTIVRSPTRHCRGAAGAVLAADGNNNRASSVYSVCSVDGSADGSNKENIPPYGAGLGGGRMSLFSDMSATLLDLEEEEDAMMHALG